MRQERVRIQPSLMREAKLTSSPPTNLLLHLGHDFGVVENAVQVELVLGGKLSGEVLGEGHVE